MWTLWISAALAGPPSVETVGSDTIVGTVSLAASPETVLAKLADPRFVAKVDGGKTQVTPRDQDGDCMVVDYVSPSTFLTVTYTVKRCKTATGYAATMMESNAFDAYGTKWTITPEGEGTLLRYELSLVSNLSWVPTSIVMSTTKSSIKKLMRRFEAHFAEG